MAMTLRTAILGYGRNGSTMHAGAIEANSAFEMAAVCDIDPGRRRQAAERFRCNVYADHQEMLARERLDLVCIVTRSDQHCEMACDCLGRGVNVLVTKPWAVNAGEAECMIASARQSGAKLLPWLPARWGCDLVRLKTLVNEGRIGKVFMIRRIVSGFGTRCDWQTESRYGGGYLLNWGPHIVDTSLVLANAGIESVYGRMKQVINPGDAEDMFMAVISMSDGAIVQAEYTISPIKHPTWFIQGSAGSIVVRETSMEIHSIQPAQPVDPTKFSSMQTDDGAVTREQLAGSIYGDTARIYGEIADAMSGGSEFPVRPDDALRLSRVLDAIRESDGKNEVVRFQDPL